MTDDIPSPTTRMPVPDPRSDAPTEGWPGTAAEADPAGPANPPPPAPPAAPPVDPPPPIPPAVARARRDGADPGRRVSVLFGVVILVVGLWFLAEQTLGLEMPSVRWSQVWPVILIGIGLWVVLGSTRRGPR